MNDNRINHNVEFLPEDITLLQGLLQAKLDQLFPEKKISNAEHPEFHTLCNLHDKLSNYREDRMSEEEWEMTYGNPDPDPVPSRDGAFPIDYRWQGLRKGY